MAGGSVKNPTKKPIDREGGQNLQDYFLHGNFSPGMWSLPGGIEPQAVDAASLLLPEAGGQAERGGGAAGRPRLRTATWRSRRQGATFYPFRVSYPNSGVLVESL